MQVNNSYKKKKPGFIRSKLASGIFLISLSEHVESVKPTCSDEEEENNDSSVAKIEQCVHKATHLQFGEEEMHAVKEEVDGSETRCQERSPPPVVILG